MTERMIREMYAKRVPNGSQMTHEQFANGSQITRESFNSSDVVPKKKVSKEVVKAAIVSYLRNNPKATYQEIGDEVEIKKTTVFEYLSELVEAGIIERIGNNRSGYWKVL